MMKFKEKKGSALLISFFIMAILILVGLSVSGIIFRDVGVVRTSLNGLSAAYAAEGMSEIGLQIVKNRLPGYEVSDYELELSNGVDGILEIIAKGEIYPCEEQGVDGAQETEWRNLALNESVTIPLFQDGENGIEDFSQFSVEYYLPDNALVQGNVLRWKILGLTKTNKKTEAISDYLEGGSTSKFFGSDGTAKFYDSAYDGSYTSYIYNEAYPISQFLGDHTYSYLILSNVVQLSGGTGSNQDADDADINTINFKMDSSSGPVCEYVELNSSSDFANVRKSVKTLVKEGENLPVFDFALYQTDSDKKKSATSAGTTLGGQNIYEIIK